jgi:hypothetical protein
MLGEAFRETGASQGAYRARAAPSARRKCHIARSPRISRATLYVHLDGVEQKAATIEP